jgi:hypothetical protein
MVILIRRLQNWLANAKLDTFARVYDDCGDLLIVTDSGSISSCRIDVGRGLGEGRERSKDMRSSEIGERRSWKIVFLKFSTGDPGTAMSDLEGE